MDYKTLKYWEKIHIIYNSREEIKGLISAFKKEQARLVTKEMQIKPETFHTD